LIIRYTNWKATAKLIIPWRSISILGSSATNVMATILTEFVQFKGIEMSLQFN
jgi:hypothetical protein